jgi:hypothetical protein
MSNQLIGERAVRRGCFSAVADLPRIKAPGGEIGFLPSANSKSHQLPHAIMGRAVGARSLERGLFAHRAIAIDDSPIIAMNFSLTIKKTNVFDEWVRRLKEIRCVESMFDRFAQRIFATRCRCDWSQQT